MKKISNPLTIIGLFAGIAEVAGTVVLPLVPESTQDIFIWYVMGFPVLLVILFFITLNKNPKVLYAPSDFNDEKNFMELLAKADNIITDTVKRIPEAKEDLEPLKRFIEETALLKGDGSITTVVINDNATSVLFDKKASAYLLIDNKKHAIVSESFLIGKSEAADLKIMDKSISRKHAVITSKDNCFHITDLHSLNGTFLNGKRINPDIEYEIHFGSMISFSDVIAHFYVD